MGRWIEIVRSGGEGSLGAALVRLAREAEAVHRFEVARMIGGGLWGEERAGGAAPRVEGMTVEEALAAVEGWEGGEAEVMGEVEGVTVEEMEALLGGASGKGGAA